MMRQPLAFIFSILLLASPAFAVSQNVTLSGHLTKPDGTSLSSSNVDFKFSIFDSASACVVYQETIAGVDFSSSSGGFDVTLGSGTLIFPTDGRTLKDIFNNSAAMPCLSGSTYTPTATDTRILGIQFIDQTETPATWRSFTSGITLNSVPSAMYAGTAEKLGTNVASDFVIKTGIPTCTAGQFLTWDGTSLTCAAAAGGGSGTVTSVSGTAPIAVATGTTTPVISIAKADATTNGYLASTDWSTFNGKQAAGNYITALSGDVSATGPGSVPATINKLQGQTLTLTSPTIGEFIRYSGTAFVNTVLVAGDIPNLAWSKITSGTPTTLAGYGITDALSSSAGTDVNTPSTIVKRDSSGKFNTTTVALSNLILNDGDTNTATLQAPLDVTTNYTLKLPAAQGGSNQVMVNDGSGNLSWLSMTVATTVSANAPLSVGGTGSAPVVSIAQATTSQDGYLSSTDFNTFNNKQSTALTSGKIWVGNGGNLATQITPGGDVVMTNAGAFTVKKIYNTAVSATAPTGAGQVLRYDGATQYIPGFMNLSDIKATINPFGSVFASTACTPAQSMYYQSASDTFQCQGIAIADSQVTYASQSQKTFFAAPTGASGAPTFRTIASTDVSSFAFVNGGNTFGSAAVIGTTDNNNLNFKTNSTISMTLDTAGRLGVSGVSSPRSALDVNGTILSSPSVSNASPTIDFMNGNMQYTTLACGPFTLYNLKDGGSYMFVVKGTTASTCSFTAYSDAGGTALTVHLPPDHAQIIAGKHTIYNIAVLGTDVYFSWTPGY